MWNINRMFSKCMLTDWAKNDKIKAKKGGV